MKARIWMADKCEILGVLCFPLALMAVIVGLALTVLAWLMTGNVENYALTDLGLDLFGREAGTWFYYPSTWQGLHTILDWTPVWIGVAITIWLIAILLFRVAETLEAQANDRKE